MRAGNRAAGKPSTMHLTDIDVCVDDRSMSGHAQTIALRSYRPMTARGARARPLPIVLYFHGGGFVKGSLADADAAAHALARRIPAWVVSVGYSLSPTYPFPVALEDGYLAARWAIEHATAHDADSRRMGIAGHDAGGNLATCIAAMARDRGGIALQAQALLAPLLDPSMTRTADERYVTQTDLCLSECAACYRAYLPECAMRLHPYAAPLESRRLKGLPAALIASAQNDLLHIEAEKYASVLIAAGVPTQVTRYPNASHGDLSHHAAALDDIAMFFRQRLAVE